MSVSFRRLKEFLDPFRRPPAPEALRLPSDVLTRARMAGTVTFLVGWWLAFLWANTHLSASYLFLRDAALAFEGPGARFSTTLRGAVNNGLMALYFFSLALGARRRFDDWAEDWRARTIVPALAALGALVLPTLLTRALAGPSLFAAGLALGGLDFGLALTALAAAGRRPKPNDPLIIFAVAINAGWMVSLFFSRGGISWTALALCAGVFAVALGLRALGARGTAALSLFAIALVVAWRRTGLFPPLVGILVAALIPGTCDVDERKVTEFAEEAIDDYDRAMDEADGDRCSALAGRLTAIAASAQAPVDRWQARALGWLTWLVLPLFGWVNGGIPLDGVSPGKMIVGLSAAWFIGRPLGVIAVGTLAKRRWQPEASAGHSSVAELALLSVAGGIPVAVGAIAAFPPPIADSLLIWLGTLSVAGTTAAGLLISQLRGVGWTQAVEP